MNYTEERPWGTFENLLDADYCKVKRLIIRPGQRPSYQYHHQRAEHWVVVSGEALVTLDDIDVRLSAGEHIYIPIGSKHRIQNVGDKNLIFIEVQCGTYFGEDDIVRLSDDYSRS